MQRSLKLMGGLQQKSILLLIGLPELGRHILNGPVRLREAVGHNKRRQETKA
ncbi:hypothetical protein D3C75_1013340 [compost metagenome]